MPCTREELENRERSALADYAQFSAESRGRLYEETGDQDKALEAFRTDRRIRTSQPCGGSEVVHRFRCFSLREQELADEVSRISELRALSEHRSKLRNGFLRLSLQFEHRSERAANGKPVTTRFNETTLRNIATIAE